KKTDRTIPKNQLVSARPNVASVLGFGVWLFLVEVVQMVVTKGIESKIERVFEYVDKKGINFADKKGKRLSSSTIKTYTNVVKTYDNWLKETHGITVDRAKPRHAEEYLQMKIDNFKAGNGSAFTVKQFVHALHAFREVSAKSGIFKHICNVGKKEKMLEMAKTQGVFRKAADSHSMKANHSDWSKVQNAIGDRKSRYKDYVMNIHEAQRMLGLRVHEAVKMQAKDINFKEGTIKIVGKGGLTRFVKVQDKEYLHKLEALCKGKKGGSDVFRVQNRKGNPPSKKERQQIVQEAIHQAAKSAGVNQNGKVYTTHSARKAYAQERVNELKKLSEKQMENVFAKACAENPKIAEKAKVALKHIRGKFENKENAAKRVLSKKEMILFLVSCEIGHFRLDIMRYYVQY
ncbi:tyrosine-type recombinase/integrase, partial [Bacillus cereus group sp. BfR-BA-01326]|uniref:tyrosine-type recombinase/integrase n=1 Tax=Bacillus cereus group sp. BfR-BA-01326 TaxID=2920302 RepID=UPI001F565067